MDAGKSKGSSFGLTYPVLTRGNYTTWALKMKVFMQAQGVWSAVEPEEKAAVEEKTDKIALAMIYQGIPEDMLLSIAGKKTAKDGWEAIKVMCQGDDRVKKAKIQTLKAEFEALRMNDNEQLDDFSMKLNGLVSTIRALGEEMKESYVVKKLLRVVPSRFLQIASTIEQFGDLETMTIEEAVGSLQVHEERIKGQKETIGSKLLMTAEDWSRQEKTEESKLLLTREDWLKRTNKESTDGHASFKGRGGRSFQGTGRDRSTVRCFNCNVLGHYAAECKRSRRERNQKQEANLVQINDDEPALLLSELDENKRQMVLLNEENVIPKLEASGDKKKFSQLWYLDNGASNHMTGDKTKFSKLDEGVTGEVKFGDGSTVCIKGKGSVSFMCKTGEEKVFTDVFYIPTLCNNIISLGQMSEEGNKVVLDGEFLWVYGGDGRLLMKVKRSGNRLYKIMLEETHNRCLLTKSEENSQLWHARLGHVNWNAMNFMKRNEMVVGLPSLVQPKEACTGCLMAKQTRTVFPSQSKYVSKKALELIHGDICGPISPPTPSGKRYFLLLVDDFSRKMWVYFLSTKDEAFEYFKKFKALVENGSEKMIKALRTDRGGEFCSYQFTSYCENAGILRHYTAPYSPQQNGVVERRNRTVVEMARSFLKEKQVPAEFWGEAVNHSVYVLNRLPTRTLSTCTPHEIWSGLKPDISHLRVFGCCAYMKVPSVYTKKLDDRSKCVVYFGKEAGTKAHRVFDPVERRIHVSRDVVFAESKSWAWNDTTGYIDSIAEKAHAEFFVEEVHDQQTNEGDTRESVMPDSSPDSSQAIEAVSEGSVASNTPSSTPSSTPKGSDR